MIHKKIFRGLSLVCACLMLLMFAACSPVSTVKSWFSKWQDDKPYESYDLNQYITLGEYKGVTAAFDPMTTESIEADAMKYFTENGIGADDPAKKTVSSGDGVRFSFEGTGEGLSADVLAGMKSDSYDLVIGSNAFIPGFEDQMIGKPRNEFFDVNVTFPADYQEASLQNKAITFKCKIFEIQSAPSEITDALVNQLTGGQLKTKAEFLAYVKDSLNGQNINAAFEAAYAKTEIKGIPEKEQKYQDDLLEKDAQRAGVSVEEYIQGQNQQAQITLEQYNKDTRDESIKREMFAFAIAQKENITANDEDMQALLNDIRNNNQETGTDGEIYSKYGGKGRLIRSVIQNKVAEFIYQNAKDSPYVADAAETTTAKP